MGGAAGSASAYEGLETYRLIEADAAGTREELFRAPDDPEAVSRVEDVGEGTRVELWCGLRLVGRWSGKVSRPPES